MPKQYGIENPCQATKEKPKPELLWQKKGTKLSLGDRAYISQKNKQQLTHRFYKEIATADYYKKKERLQKLMKEYYSSIGISLKDKLK